MIPKRRGIAPPFKFRRPFRLVLMTAIDIAAVQKIIEEVAAAEIMPRFRKLKDSDVHTKNDNEIVTVADRASEESLIKRLSALVPGSVVVAEECCDCNPGILSRFGSENDVWVVDPLDGTWNFIEGRCEFGVMVACVRRKETVAAWIHDPNTKHTLSAEKGSGVWLQGKKMTLAGRNPDVPRLVLIGSRLRSIVTKPQLACAVASLPALTIGTAVAFDYGRAFEGKTLFANSKAPRVTSLLYRMAKPWDHMPGSFLFGEGGGVSATLYEKPYDPEDGKSGLLLAPDPLAWKKIHDILKPVRGELALADSC